MPHLMRPENLTPIPAFGALIGFTHKWTDTLRTTAELWLRPAG
jgi:hypothetical protein